MVQEVSQSESEGAHFQVQRETTRLLQLLRGVWESREHMDIQLPRSPNPIQMVEPEESEEKLQLGGFFSSSEELSSGLSKLLW